MEKSFEVKLRCGEEIEISESVKATSLTRAVRIADTSEGKPVRPVLLTNRKKTNINGLLIKAVINWNGAILHVRVRKG